MQEPGKKAVANWKSEFTMGALDFERFHFLKMAVDERAAEVAMFTLESVNYLKQYRASLFALFLAVQPIFMDDKRTAFQKKFDDVVSDIEESIRASRGKRVNVKAHKELLEIHKLLYIEMQFKGLGIMVGREMKDTERMRLALGMKE